MSSGFYFLKEIRFIEVLNIRLSKGGFLGVSGSDEVIFVLFICKFLKGKGGVLVLL